MLFLVLGLLQIPEVQTRLNPDFLWTDQLHRLEKEETKADFRLKRLVSNLDALKEGEQPQPRKLHWLKKETISVTNSLHFLDAMLANLRRELQAGLPQAAPARRTQLLAYLKKVKTMQLHCEDLHRRLQEASQRVQQFNSG
ncbi:MAG: hypothetical protein ACOZF2_07465 [Thermodesulfobacteriota bacterium]